MITESEFITATDRTLASIGKALDAALASSDIDLDWRLHDGILEIECDDGVTRQVGGTAVRVTGGDVDRAARLIDRRRRPDR